MVGPMAVARSVRPLFTAVAFRMLRLLFGLLSKAPANLHLVPTETNGSIGLLAWAGELQFLAVTFLGYLLYRLMTLSLLGIGACPSSSVVLSLERRNRGGLVSPLVRNEQVGCHVACERLGRMSYYQSRDSYRPDGSRSAKRMLRGAARRLRPFGIFCVSRRMISRSSGS